MNPISFRSDRDDLLFTPGPLTTSAATKQAMLRDLGSRDSGFLDLTQSIRHRLLKTAEVGDDYTAVLLQGSGTFSVEAVLSSVVPRDGKVLIISNGAYGHRMVEMARAQSIDHFVLEYAEDQVPILGEIEKAFRPNEHDLKITHLAMVHCETTSGIVNPIQEVGKLCQQYQKTYIVDAMSSFGAMPISFEEASIDYLISSPNKCLEGVPGFAFVIARQSELKKSKGNARSLSLDLFAQWESLERAGEFRYTPPIQTILAFEQALNELDDEGGVQARMLRYQESHRVLLEGMMGLGFKTYLTPVAMGPIISSFHELNDSRFQYKEFYERLKKRGFVIYSGKVSNAQCFRVGNIGRLFPADVINLLSAMRDVLLEMGVQS